MSHTLQWPAKGSPAPAVRGPNVAETLLARVEQVIALAPLNAEYLGILKEVAGGLATVLAEIDPDGQKQVQRLATINAAVAKGPAGIPDLLTYINDDPSHPDDTTEFAMWNAVELGYEPTGPVETKP